MGWVKPTVEAMSEALALEHAEDGSSSGRAGGAAPLDVRISVMLVPCPHASGAEAQVVRGFAGVARCQDAQHFWRSLLTGRTREAWSWRPRGVVIGMGGEQAYAVRDAADHDRRGSGGDARLFRRLLALRPCACGSHPQRGRRTDGCNGLLLLLLLLQVLLAKRLGYKSALYVEQELFFSLGGVDLVLCASHAVARQARRANRRLQAAQVRVVGDLLGAAARRAPGGGRSRSGGGGGDHDDDGGETTRPFVLGVLPGSKAAKLQVMAPYFSAVIDAHRELVRGEDAAPPPPSAAAAAAAAAAAGAAAGGGTSGGVEYVIPLSPTVSLEELQSFLDPESNEVRRRPHHRRASLVAGLTEWRCRPHVRAAH
eukprot:scaffold659_cov329-Prasinococcus_capsulatus_cf.AAC.21